MDTVSVVAPAKVNLFLGIGARRSDGYHDATTVMHTLALHDRITMMLLGQGEEATLFEPGDAAQPLRQFDAKVAPSSGLSVSANVCWASGLETSAIADKDNLACRAVHALARSLGRAEDELVRIVIDKRIPARTGLGGGSSDAAAALVGAAHLWGVAAGSSIVEEVARSLGADVAFFLHGGCALLDGTGDNFVRALDPSKAAVVVVKPAGGVSTPEAYAAFDAHPSKIPDEVLKRACSAQSAQDVPLFNNLAPASETLLAELGDTRVHLCSQPGVEGVLLCGSGAGTFGLCASYEAAQKASAAAQARGWWARATSFASLAASILPR